MPDHYDHHDDARLDHYNDTLAATRHPPALTTEHVDARPAFVADDVTELHVARLTGWPTGETPVLWLNDVRGGLVEPGIARDGAGVFLRVTGKSTQRITLAGDPSWTPESIDLGPEVAKTAVILAAGSFGTARR